MLRTIKRYLRNRRLKRWLKKQPRSVQDCYLSWRVEAHMANSILTQAGARLLKRRLQELNEQQRTDREA